MASDTGQPARAAWVEEFPASITVCDTQGIILEMNRKACASFADDGGERLLGAPGDEQDGGEQGVSHGGLLRQGGRARAI